MPSLINFRGIKYLPHCASLECCGSLRSRGLPALVMKMCTCVIIHSKLVLLVVTVQCTSEQVSAAADILTRC